MTLQLAETSTLSLVGSLRFIALNGRDLGPEMENLCEKGLDIVYPIGSYSNGMELLHFFPMTESLLMVK